MATPNRNRQSGRAGRKILRIAVSSQKGKNFSKNIMILGDINIDMLESNDQIDRGNIARTKRNSRGKWSFCSKQKTNSVQRQ